VSDLRTRIAAALERANKEPQPFDKGPVGYEYLADAVIRELDMGIPCADSGCRMRQIARKANLKEEAPTLKTDDPKLTLHDTITFAIRDGFSSRLWADADDIATVAIKAVAKYRDSVSEDEFIDSILAAEDEMTYFRNRVAEILDSVYFPGSGINSSQLSRDAAEALIQELKIRPEWGSLDENNDGILADTKEELSTVTKHETIKSRYITEWEPAETLPERVISQRDKYPIDPKDVIYDVVRETEGTVSVTARHSGYAGWAMAAAGPDQKDVKDRALQRLIYARDYDYGRQ
jgi:hypothetical protein